VVKVPSEEGFDDGDEVMKENKAESDDEAVFERPGKAEVLEPKVEEKVQEEESAEDDIF